MTYYAFCSKSSMEVEVVKFDQDFKIEDFYKLRFEDGKWHCNCPSYKQPCKHIELRRQWASLESLLLYNFYDAERCTWIKNPFLPSDYVQRFYETNT